MPVPLESHDPELELTPGTTKSDIVGYLYRNDDYGYSPREVADELDIPHNTAKVTLKRLFDEEYLEKTPDGYYHARSDREDLYRYTAALDGLERMFETHEESVGAEFEAEADDSTEETPPAPLSDGDIEEAVALIETEATEERE